MRTLLISGLFALQLAAQTITEPPILLQLNRRSGVTNPISAPPYAAAGAAVNVFGMTSLTGPLETWFLEAHGSFGSIEDINDAMRNWPSDDRAEILSGEILAEARNLIAIYRPGLSYRPDQAARLLPKTRYFSVTLYRIRPGAEADFSDALHTRKDIFDSINLDRPEIAYQIISGAPSGTYLLLAPLASLRVLDEGLPLRSLHAESRAAGAANKARADFELSRGQVLFRVQPQISYVSDEVAAEFPEFWRAK